LPSDQKLVTVTTVMTVMTVSEFDCGSENALIRRARNSAKAPPRNLDIEPLTKGGPKFYCPQWGTGLLTYGVGACA